MLILHVVGRLAVGGAESLIMNIYNRAKKDNVQFDFVAHGSVASYKEEIEDLGGRVFICPSYTGKNHFEYIKWWKKFFDEHPEYNIIHTHVRSTAAIILRLAKKHNLYTISHAHSISNGKGMNAWIKKFLFQRNIVKFTDVAMVCSEKAGLWQFGKNYRKQTKAIEINNGIDVEGYYRTSGEKEQLKCDFDLKQSFVVGNVSRFTAAKNHNFLLEIFSEIKKRKSNAKLILIGAGSEREKILEQIGLLNLENDVLMLGERLDVPDILNAMDVFVFPSKWEGFGIAALEAQAAGLPTFVSNGVSEAVCVSPLAKMISLNKSASEWAEVILENSSLKCDDVATIIRNAGFDINLTVKTVLNTYRDLERTK